MSTKTLRDFDASLSNLSRSLGAYHAGDPYAHLPAAVELRKLLCEDKGTRDHSLALRMHPDLEFHGLRGRFKVDERMTMYLPARLHFDGTRKQGFVTELFNLRSPGMKLAAWRSQPFVNIQLTIRTFIKDLADREGAHSDATISATQALLKGVMFAGAPSDAELLIAIGDYVLMQLLLRRANDVVKDIKAMFKAERESKGPGVLLMDAPKSPRPYSDGLTVEFLTLEQAAGIGMAEADIKKEMLKLIENFAKPDSTLLLYRSHRNGYDLMEFGMENPN